ncbi:zf-HC2 domain-containing protein [Paenibacillus aurantius]|uniref:Anti-sigma-W factor RsiW n=1 Tax=Paenibacillus aurantius TaxID=2918900 RepID=A0AA96LG48_9BACL|nr:zf-HC2 domain-containing protein [Paenibacillus aurantius]WNQ13206.1 zf-HC2 domain-containing protein [Paenibacillus aurantius]
MKTHPEDQLTAYIDKELGEEERGAVENHLKECPACRTLVEEILDMQQQLVTSYSGVGAPRNIEWQVMQAIDGQGEASSIGWKGLTVSLAGLLALLAWVIAGSPWMTILLIMAKSAGVLAYGILGSLAAIPALTASMAVLCLIILLLSVYFLRRLLRTAALQGGGTS